jgi:hypothetical protein
MNKSAELDEKQKDITKMLNEFDSAVGKLVIAFDTLGIIFPLALVGGFIVCTAIRIQTIRIRKNLMFFYDRRVNPKILNKELFLLLHYELIQKIINRINQYLL